MKSGAADAPKYYRYEGRFYSTGSEEYGYSSRLSVDLLEFDVMRRTPRGVWIARWCGDDKGRFVLDGARKQYACPTVDEARESFVARKRRHIRILEAQLAGARQALRWINEQKEGAA